jgi:transcriptional regulator with XRE-family HTH domain
LVGEEQRLAARRQLGAELRALREARELTGQQLADQLGWSQAKVSRIEGARTRAEVADVAALLEVLGTAAGERARLLGVAETAAGPASNWRNSTGVGLTRRQRDFINSEAAATRIRHYQPVLLPGYLQTPDYARRVIEFAGAKDVDRALQARLARGKVLIGESPPTYEIVLLETVLRWRPFEPPLMVEQLRALETAARRRNIVVRVVSLDREQRVYVQHPFVVYDFGEDTPPEVLIETTRTDLRLTEPSDVQAYAGWFERLQRSALPAGDSLRLIRRVAHELEKHPREEP